MNSLPTRRSNMTTIVKENTYLLLGASFLLSSILYLTLSKSQRDVLLRRFHIRGRRASSASTPPRSFSPEKQSALDTKSLSSVTTTPDYTDAFPPSVREGLVKIAETLPPAQKKKLLAQEFDDETFQKNIIPFTTNYMECDKLAYTPMGVSVDEIKALGDFPDYAELSGVPLPEPYKEFEIEKAKARPYRPFRWNYHQTMSLTKLETDWWLELEDTYKTRIAQRKSLYEQHGKSVLDWLPGSELATKELMEMTLQFLCARYPHYFTLSADKATFHNAILNTKTDVQSKHPLLVMLDHIPEDFAIMLRDPETGYYHFRAGMICSALGWNVGTKIGLQLHQIHAPIPDYKEKMQFSMDRFFSKMPSSRPIQRGSWGLEVDQPLYMPPGDPHESYRSHQSPAVTLARSHLRVDWQTLRRLPLSGAIVFNFKALFTPVAEFRDEAYIPSLILKILKEGKKNLMEYKNTWHVEHVVVPALEGYASEQVRDKVVEEGWEPHTLEESPWFPGWEGKWKRQQGY